MTPGPPYLLLSIFILGLIFWIVSEFSSTPPTHLRKMLCSEKGEKKDIFGWIFIIYTLSTVYAIWLSKKFVPWV